MTNYTLTFPDDFDDYEWEVKSKGWFGDAKLKLLGKECRLNFYDPVRLGQEIESELHCRTAFFEHNLIVIQSVTRSDMKSAVEILVQSGEAGLLVPE
jgi:hypothetical protein